MKKLTKVYAIVLTIGFFGVLISASPVNEPEEVCMEEALTEEEALLEEEALYCSATINGNSASCWFCDCQALIAQLQIS